MGKKDEAFESALRKTTIPILTLDNRWHMLFGNTDTQPTLTIKRLEEKLNDLVKRQGKLTNETKDVRKLKKKLMSEIMPLVDEYDHNPSAALGKQIDDRKRLIEDCNAKMAANKGELDGLPEEIEAVNYNLMRETMDICYERLSENTAEIEEVDKWITQTRIELKKKMVRKQEREKQNHDLYSYMHAVFGAEVIDLFDMKYNPEERRQAELAKKKKK